MRSIACRRCKNEAEGFDEAPLPGAVGAELFEHTCQPCFRDWMNTEVMIINEYRLDLGQPHNQELLNIEMSKFLSLPSAPEGEPMPPLNEGR